MKVVHSVDVTPNITMEASIYAHSKTLYFIPPEGFDFKNAYRFQVTFYPKWVTKFLSLFNIKGEVKHFKGYKINE